MFRGYSEEELWHGRRLFFSSQPVGTWSYETFVSKMKAVFDHPDYHGNAFNRLLSLRQGKGSVADYSVDFWTYVRTPSAETCLSLITQTSHGDKIPALRGVFLSKLMYLPQRKSPWR